MSNCNNCDYTIPKQVSEKCPQVNTVLETLADHLHNAKLLQDTVDKVCCLINSDKMYAYAPPLVCIGQDLQFIAGGGVSYNWVKDGKVLSSQQNYLKSSVTENDGGLYIVHIVDCNGCKHTEYVPVYVQDCFNDEVKIVGTANVCVGSDIQLFGTDGFDSYCWFDPNNVQIATTKDVVIPTTSEDQSGIYSVKAVKGEKEVTDRHYVSVELCCEGRDVSFSAPPVACKGESFTLTISGGVKYKVKAPNGKVYSSDDVITITGGVGSLQLVAVDELLTGDYEATIEDNNGCIYIRHEHVKIEDCCDDSGVDVNYIQDVCVGDDITIYVTGADTVKVNTPGGACYEQSTTVIPTTSTDQSGFYEVVYTVGSCEFKRKILIKVKPCCCQYDNIDTVGFHYANIGGTISINVDNAPDGGTYAWSGPNGFSSTLQNIVIENAEEVHGGVYYLTVTVGECTIDKVHYINILNESGGTGGTGGEFNCAPLTP